MNLQNTDKLAYLLSPVDAQKLKSIQLRGGGASSPGLPLGLRPQTSSIGYCACHVPPSHHLSPSSEDLAPVLCFAINYSNSTSHAVY